MFRCLHVSLTALLPALVVACQSGGADWNDSDALAAKKLEVSMEPGGRPSEVEYHISPRLVPDEVRKAMDKLHPGGAYTGAEKEWNGGVLYWELSRTVNGMEVEAMFLPSGKLHSEEIQVRESGVPDAVRAAASAWIGRGRVSKWEEIRDGSREVVEYHVKATRGGKNYKLMLSTSGDMLGVFREIPAEIEVPAD